ncbi:hypothetical protein ACHAWC_004568 [Mediolabrus comicus]
MWQSLKSDFSEFIRSAGEEGGSAIASLDKKLNDLDDKLDEITGGRRGNDDGNDELDYTGGDANDVLYNNNEEDLSGISDAAMNVGKSAASFLAGVGETVGGAAASIRLHQSTGRPPFVMAAVDDDDDEYVEGEEQQQQEEEEEEAQLGWSDSEEEEEEGSSSGDDEVDFTNEKQSLALESFDVVKMRQGLSHVEKERNHCLQMVEDRSQEICKLKLFVDQFNFQGSTSSPQDLETLKRDVLWFKTLLAVTQQDEDPNQLKTILSEMRKELVRSGVRITNDETIVDLEMKIQSTKESLANSQATINQTLLVEEEVKLTALKKKTEELKVRLCALQEEIEASRGNIADLQLQKEELLEKLVDDRQVAAKVRSEQNSPSSSTSSGVLVGRND